MRLLESAAARRWRLTCLTPMQVERTETPMSTHQAIPWDFQSDLTSLLQRLRTYALVVGVLGAAGWLSVNGLPPAKPTESFPASQLVVAASAARPDASNFQGSAIEQRRDPVPLVRKVLALAGPTHNEPPVASDERETQDDLGRKAAKLAAEVDGYMRVSIVGRTSNGAWRAKGYRGTAEVLLTVDGTGRVASD
jgi:hypothetical protein